MDELLSTFPEPLSELKLLDFEGSNNEDSIPDEDVYDAVNEETFGAGISPTFEANDLEEFSTRTANLALFDEPGCSVQLPDPSQIPIPILGSDLTDKNVSKESCATAESLSSIWANGSFNGIGSLTEAYIGHLKTEYQNASSDEQKKQLQHMLDAGLSINHQLVAESDPMAKKNWEPPGIAEQQKSLPKMPVSDPSRSNHAGPLSLEELERRMLVEAAVAAAHQNQHAQRQLHETAPMPPIHSPFLYRPAQENAPPPFPIVSPHQLIRQIQQTNQSYQMAVKAAVASGLPPPPPPPIPSLPLLPHPSIIPPICSLQHRMATPASGILPAALIPPNPPLTYNDAFMPCHAHPLHTNKIVPSMPQLAMIPSSLHPRVEGKNRQKLNGLPSGKTISDFALDPYAGFMSTKEREWLIKIHIIQCLGTGDPLEEDFYYTVWKQKNVLQKAPEQWRNKEKPKYYKFEATFPSTGYTAPSFFGSLGKPIHSSANQPRQIIEVTSDGTEEDLSLSKNRQKRLRAALMKIENGALALLDCRSIRRKLRFFEETRITEYLDQREITSRVARFSDNLAHVDASLFSEDALPTIMLIQKGRRCIYEWLTFLGEESDREVEFAHLYRLLLAVPKFAKRMPEEALRQFSGVITTSFTDLSYEKLVDLLHSTDKWELSLISDSKLVQLVLLTLILFLIGKSGWNLRLVALQGTGAAHLLHSIPSSALKLHPTSDAELFKPTQWGQLRQWLIREQSRSDSAILISNGSIALWIVQNQAFVLL